MLVIVLGGPGRSRTAYLFIANEAFNRVNFRPNIHYFQRIAQRAMDLWSKKNQPPQLALF